MNNCISLTPGFSAVPIKNDAGNRFNGFSAAGQPLKRLEFPVDIFCPLKPGVN